MVDMAIQVPENVYLHNMPICQFCDMICIILKDESHPLCSSSIGSEMLNDEEINKKTVSHAWTRNK